MENEPSWQKEEFDREDLLYFSRLTPEEKLNYLEKLVRSLEAITPPQAKEWGKKLKKLGF